MAYYSIRIFLSVLVLFNLLSSCADPEANSCVEFEDAQVLTQVLEILEKSNAANYDESDPNYFSKYAETSKITLEKCSKIVKATFAPKCGKDAICYTGRTSIFTLDLAKNKLLHEEWDMY